MPSTRLPSSTLTWKPRVQVTGWSRITSCPLAAGSVYARQRPWPEPVGHAAVWPDHVVVEQRQGTGCRVKCHGREGRTAEAVRVQHVRIEEPTRPAECRAPARICEIPRTPRPVRVDDGRDPGQVMVSDTQVQVPPGLPGDTGESVGQLFAGCSAYDLV